jgi:hypothetical protein
MTSPFRVVNLTYANDDLENIGSWLPNTDGLEITNLPEDRNVKGKNNADYIIADVKCTRLGHVYVSTDERWNLIENTMIRYFSTKDWICEKAEGNKNRNIDFIRKHKKKDIYQYMECKKTSGHSIEPPSMVKSSRAQLHALLNHKEKVGKKMLPSLYILVSVDFCHKHRSWVNTYWAMPVIKQDDFIVIETSKYRTFKPREIMTSHHKLV